MVLASSLVLRGQPDDTRGGGAQWLFWKKKLFMQQRVIYSLFSKLKNKRFVYKTGRKMCRVIGGEKKFACSFAWEEKKICLWLWERKKKVCTGEKESISPPPTSHLVRPWCSLVHRPLCPLSLGLGLFWLYIKKRLVRTRSQKSPRPNDRGRRVRGLCLVLDQRARLGPATRPTGATWRVHLWRHLRPAGNLHRYVPHSITVHVSILLHPGLSWKTGHVGLAVIAQCTAHKRRISVQICTGRLKRTWSVTVNLETSKLLKLYFTQLL